MSQFWEQILPEYNVDVVNQLLANLGHTLGDNVSQESSGNSNHRIAQNSSNDENAPENYGQHLICRNDGVTSGSIRKMSIKNNCKNWTTVTHKLATGQQIGSSICSKLEHSMKILSNQLLAPKEIISPKFGSIDSIGLYLSQ
ncbi:hypothetical protein RDI58_029230 [Solanum bulbocastanum]|uniref:Uncharacterized protein n=1 Tax=Solanum bulbocastanum TaxID=147425 RepID=A0AAN8SXM6_SOLBU